MYSRTIDNSMSSIASTSARAEPTGSGRAAPARPVSVQLSNPIPRWLYGISTSLALLSSAQPAHALQRGGPGPNGGGGGGGGGGGDGSGAAPRHGPQLLTTLAAAPEPVILTLASFAVTKLAYVRLTKLFRETYMKATGTDVRFRLTFAGSGVQARAVIDGLPADIVALALTLDVQKIADSGLINSSWKKRYPLNSTVCETTAAMVVRKGNPKNIQGWEDLLRDDVEVVIANPKTAGVARWIFLALWGVRMAKGDAAAIQFVTKVFENVVVQPRDAREASDVFYRQKIGDVLLTYENEVFLTNEIYGDKALPCIVPKHNIRIECPLSPVDKVLEPRGPAVKKAADDFCRFLFTSEAQAEFGKVGFRLNPKLAKQAAAQQQLPPAKLWSVDKELGGWTKAQVKFFDAGAILDQIQLEVGQTKLALRKAKEAAAKK